MFMDLIRVYIVFNLLLQVTLLIAYPSLFGLFCSVVAVVCCDFFFNSPVTK